MTREGKAIRNEQMRQCRASGYSLTQIAERFGVAERTAKNICVGVLPLHNQYTSGSFDRIANCKRIIERYHPDLEYFGGFKDVDSPVDVKCKTCGYVFSRSMITLRKAKNTFCPACQEAKKQQEKEQAKIEHLKIVEKNQRDRRAEKMLAKSHTQSAMKICPICNSIFMGNKTYCSEHCANQNKWMMKDRYRYKFPLEELYQRDGGICYLCGKPCDMNDKQVVNGVTIYGNYYPSREHVVPKSKGGENSWNNLRLAHRICNSLKGDSPLVEKII